MIRPWWVNLLQHWWIHDIKQWAQNFHWFKWSFPKVYLNNGPGLTGYIYIYRFEEFWRHIVLPNQATSYFYHYIPFCLKTKLAFSHLLYAMPTKNPLPRRCQQQALMMPAIVTTLKTIRITSNITTLDASEIWQSPVEIIFVEPVVQVLG